MIRDVKWQATVKAGLVIVIYSILQFGVDRMFRLNPWRQPVDIIFGFGFWITLWLLSESPYQNRRGIGRWIRLSGLVRAFLILVVSICLTSWAIYSYIKAKFISPIQGMAIMWTAFDGFYRDYKTLPGPPGPIDSRILDELIGMQDAKINAQHKIYLISSNPEAFHDQWGHSYWFKTVPFNKASLGGDNFVIISCGPNGIYENGGGDDLSFPPNLHN